MPSYAYLRQLSPFLEIFPDGRVPIVSIFPLAAEGDRPEAYLIDATQLDHRQKRDLANLFTRVWRVYFAMALVYIDQGLPLATEHFTGIETDDLYQVQLLYGDDDPDGEPDWEATDE